MLKIYQGIHLKKIMTQMLTSSVTPVLCKGKVPTEEQRVQVLLERYSIKALYKVAVVEVSF